MKPSKHGLALTPLLIVAIVTGCAALFGALELDNARRAAADGGCRRTSSCTWQVACALEQVVINTAAHCAVGGCCF